MMDFAITWHGDRPSEQLVERTVSELRELLEGGLPRPACLVFHTVLDDDDNPRVAAWGQAGDPNFHAEWTPNDEMIPMGSA